MVCLIFRVLVVATSLSAFSGAQAQQKRVGRPDLIVPVEPLGSDTRPVIVRLAPATVDSADLRIRNVRERVQEMNERLTAFGTVALAGLTLLLAVATAFLAVFTFRLWRETKGLAEATSTAGRESAAQMKESVVVATRAATAMEASARAMRESADVAQGMFAASHPPVFEVTEMSIHQPHDGAPVLVFKIENCGRTPNPLRVRNCSLVEEVGEASRARSDVESIRDKTIEAGASLKVEHVCRGFVADDLLKHPKASATFTVDDPYGDLFRSRTLSVNLWVEVADHVGGRVERRFYFSCNPPSSTFQRGT